MEREVHDVGGCDAIRAALRTPRPGLIESGTEAAMTATSADGTPTGLLTKATVEPSMEAARRRRPKKSRVESSKERGNRRRTREKA
eukprot:CAMPEP_0174889272 /NCGR_PEP_ID=MMETSP0167-20121228/4541_1 /TAXON_ID=38298 /ORGANISM="Rhodella maculata, Strain CCMP736" /LENGTH=85 /DNA_ID=CAMNT_0016126611 /DNA_START=1 /DNA_END=254 /DNA_ORIENTATION=-